MRKLLPEEFFRNSWEEYALFLAGTALIYGIFWLLRRVLSKHVSKFAEQHGLKWYATVTAIVCRTKSWFLIVAALAITIRWLELPPGFVSAFTKIWILAIALQVGFWGRAFIRLQVEPYLGQQIGLEVHETATITVLKFLLFSVLYIFLFIWALDNWGVNVTAFLTGLGVGGIAIALAVQNILGDLFASLSIVLDKPFKVGDFINAGNDYLGTIEKIGLKTTRVRSLSGEQLVFPNSDLLQARLRNFKRMEERRVVFKFGLDYKTPVEKVAKAAEMVRDIIKKEPECRFDRAHFMNYGASSLDYEVVYFVLSSDYNKYMDHNQNILLAMYRQFADQGMEFAYPTQTVYLETTKPLLTTHVVGAEQDLKR